MFVFCKKADYIQITQQDHLMRQYLKQHASFLYYIYVNHIRYLGYFLESPSK